MAGLSRMRAACACQNLICPIAMLVTGIVVGITGCVVTAVGFGTPPKDMFDYSNQAKRLAGLIMVGIAILPITMSIIGWIFYCMGRRDGETFPKPSTRDNQASSMNYPYSSMPGDKIYRPPYPTGGNDQQSSTSDSVFSERYASHYRPSDAGKVTVKSGDSFEEGRTSPPRHGGQRLTAVDEAPDNGEWSSFDIDE